jgi:hypothetical protein
MPLSLYMTSDNFNYDRARYTRRFQMCKSNLQMRKFGFILAGVLILMVVAPPTFATHFFDNPVPIGARLRFNILQGNFASTLYPLPAAGTVTAGGAPGAGSFAATDAWPVGAPVQAPGALPVGGGFLEDAWGVGEISSIEVDLDLDGVFAEAGELNAWTKVSNSGEEITAMFYGLVDNYATITSLGGLGWSGVTGTTGFIGGTIGSAYLDFYWDDTADADFTLAPGARTGLTTFPTLTDGEHFVTQRIAYDDSTAVDPWGADTGSVSSDSFNAAGVVTSASNSPFGDVAVGPAGVPTENALFDSNTIGTTTFGLGPYPGGALGGGPRVVPFDASIDIITNAVSVQPGWTLALTAGRDIKQQAAIPEPSTVLLIGVGLLGLLGVQARKRRRKSS